MASILQYFGEANRLTIRNLSNEFDHLTHHIINIQAKFYVVKAELQQDI